MVRQHISGRVLLACGAGTLFVGLVLWRAGENPDRFSLIFWHLLVAYDGHAAALLLAIAAAAYFLRGRPQPTALVHFAARHPWPIAGALFLALAAGALRAYHAHPLSMDEFSPLFQAQAFAAGRLGGSFPPDLIDWLIPSFFQGYFLTASRATGEVASSYWPGFALVLTPFTALGAPWATNAAIGALTVPLVHRLARRVGGSDDAAGWAVLFCVASSAFVVASISYYSMPAHLLCNLVFALLLLSPSVPRAALAGAVGSLALTLHNPVPHALFLAPFLVWLCTRPRPAPLVAALVAGYLPLGILLGLGWQQHLAALRHVADAGVAAAASEPPSVLRMFLAQLGSLVTVPDMRIVQARLAGLSKIWTWGAAGLLVFAAYGAWLARREPGVRVLAAALGVTFFGYFLVPFDQGHGWGYRYVHSAWFVLPVLAALGLARAGASAELRAMAAWAIVLSLVLANGLRLVQVERFVAQHLAQVPPLARAADAPQIVFVNLRGGFYVQDLVQNDPLLRSPRLVMVHRDAESNAQFMARRFPSYERREAARWGERWTPRVN